MKYKKKMKVGIDVSNIYHRSYAIVSGYDGFDITKLEWQQKLGRKFITDIASLTKKFNASELMLAFDAKPYFRNDIRSDYKGNRTRKEQEFYDVINDIYDLLKKSGYNAVKIPGLEADDLLALYGEQKDFTVLITNDADVRQCISPNTVVFTANSRNYKIFAVNTQIVIDNLGKEYAQYAQVIDPSLLRFEKVLLGDSGDNVARLLPKGNGPKKVKQVYDKFLGSDMSTDEIMKSFGFDISEQKFLEQIRMVALGSMYIPRNLYKEWLMQSKSFGSKTQLQIKEVFKGTKYING